MDVKYNPNAVGLDMNRYIKKGILEGTLSKSAMREFMLSYDDVCTDTDNWNLII